jgi:hypothetical protein
VRALCHGGPSCVGCGTPHAAHSRTKRHACSSDVSVQRQRAANPNLRRTARRCREHAPLSLARPNGERDDRCFASAVRSTARRYCPRPALPPCACAHSVPAECFCVQACLRRTRAGNVGCCKQPVCEHPVREFAGRILSCAMCRMLSGVLPRRHRINAIRVHACGRNDSSAARRHVHFTSIGSHGIALCAPLSIV